MNAKRTLDYWDPYACNREDNRKRIAAWVAKWRRLSALNLQDYMRELENAKGGGE